MEKDIPSFEDLSPTKGLNLDERKVLEHFLGKTQKEAESLFQQNPYCYWEDLMWMGTNGFTFYCKSFFNYLTSIHAEGDAASVSALCAIVEFRLETDPQSLRKSNANALSVLTYCIDHLQSFNLQQDIDKKTPHRLQKLHKDLMKLKMSL